MDVEIQTARFLDFDISSNSWVELPAGHCIQDAGSADCSSHGQGQALLSPLVIATWNIWEDERFADYRYAYILRKLFEDSDSESSPRLDVITLQEVTPEFFEVLLSHSIVRSEWLVTDLSDQLDICPNPYGTVILIRKSVVRGYRITAGFHEFENTRMQRGLNFVELCCCDSQGSSEKSSSSSGKPVLRIGTSHFESHPEDRRKRREQFEVSAGILTSPASHFADSFPESDQSAAFVPAILTGDCNICSYEELRPLLNPADDAPAPAFIDAFLATRPIVDTSSTTTTTISAGPFTSHPTFGITLPNRKVISSFGKFQIPEKRRLDYVFISAAAHFDHTSQQKQKQNHSECGFIGDEAVCEKEVAEDEEGRDGCVYASDHLGVWIRVRIRV